MFPLSYKNVIYVLWTFFFLGNGTIKVTLLFKTWGVYFRMSSKCTESVKRFHEWHVFVQKFWEHSISLSVYNFKRTLPERSENIPCLTG